MAVKVRMTNFNYDEFKINFKAALKRTTRDFCDRSTIHGLKYVNDRESNTIVRCLWCLIIVVMFCCGIAMIITSYCDFRSNLTRLNIAEENAPITELMFPAVTICPAQTVDYSKVTSIINTLKLPPNFYRNSTMEDKFSAIEQLVVNSDTFHEPSAMIMEDLLQLNNLSVLQFIEKVSWNCTDFLIRCRFATKTVDCKELFQLTSTSTGSCCSFNIIQAGLSFTNKRAITPQQRGLVVAVKMMRNVSIQDFAIMIGPNNAFPNEFLDLLYLSRNEISFLSISPHKQYVSSRVRRLNIRDRKCVLKKEIQLKYFDPYLDSHCFYDCMARNMLQYCGCIVYPINLIGGQDRVCSFKDLQCLLIKKRNTTLMDTRSHQGEDICNCLPECDFVGYDTSLMSAPMSLNKANVDSFYDDLPVSCSVVHIFFAQEIYSKLSHDLISDMLTLVSNLGSSFSLFVGISMVSVIEIFYYFTIVLWKNYVRQVVLRKKLFFRKIKKNDIRS